MEQMRRGNGPNPPVSWVNSASGDRFPIQIDLNHPLWQTFLESGSVSPAHFFRMFFSPPSYFHNPTPWRSRNTVRLAQKVSELLDSFKPGSFSYRPFKRAAKANSAQAISTDDNNNNNHEEEAIIRRSLLYANVGRPRPFYRRPTSFQSFMRASEIQLRHQDPKSLQELLRLHFLHTHGLGRLKRVLQTANNLPLFVQQLLLTFSCEDFQETGSPDGASESPTTYLVECLHENDKSVTYRASFFTSEVDKCVSNLWMEYEDFLNLQETDGVVPVLALATDNLTENVFTITEDLSCIQERDKEKIAKFVSKFGETLKRHPDITLSRNLHSQLVESTKHGILLQNPLVIKQRNLCHTNEEKWEALSKLMK